MYNVTFRRENFRGRDSFVARDAAGAWRAYGAVEDCTGTAGRELAESIFHAEEIGEVWSNADGETCCTIKEQGD